MSDEREKAFKDLVAGMQEVVRPLQIDIAKQNAELIKHTESSDKKQEAMLNEIRAMSSAHAEFRGEVSGHMQRTSSDIRAIKDAQDKNIREVARLQADNDTCKSNQVIVMRKIGAIEQGSPERSVGFWTAENGKIALLICLALTLGLLGLAGYEVTLPD